MKARYWFGLAVLAAGIGILGLRLNAQRVFELKQEILARDAAGTSVTAQLNDLRKFVFKHMNTSVRIELTASYDRAVTAAQQSGVTGDLYSRAQAACDRQGVGTVEQAACVQSYISQRLNSSNDPQNLPLKSRFTYAFSAPSWSRDLAGLGILLSLIFFTVGAVSYIRSQFKGRSY